MKIDINVLLLYRNENYTLETIIGNMCISEILYTVVFKDKIHYRITDINYELQYGDITINEYIKYRRKYRLKNFLNEQN